MKLSPSKLNLFLFLKLPNAWFSGVRLKELSGKHAVSSVKHRWINQNPFKSMYFAVQAMAAELVTGVLVMQAIQKSDKKISMLVAQNTSEFTKKATGRIHFTCQQGHEIEAVIEKCTSTGEGQKIWLESVGKNENNEVVSTFKFEWTLKVKN
ncbi:MAG: DUF4442 domain-containing protein [Psychroflexus sp.]|uniref:DUF4442 domain-containing protein n=1 Tax=Psychroflexus sp. S27 TaxID=1982757 RepID=UPI000C298319|nr:DUF4442 domain-containing protein [Psychroflexus sp. S27]PJX28413.1 thioesterase [Psychroflexus sp. S27]